MLDIRYHVISLVAVFLALGIGILLGTTLVERGLIAEQKAQIESLRTTFGEIKEKNSSLNNDLGTCRTYEDQSLDYMCAGRLSGRPFAVVADKAPDEQALGAIDQAITMAGGSLPLVVSMAPAEIYEDPQVVENLASLFQLPAEPEALEDRVLAEVVEQLKHASNAGILATLQELGVVQVRGTLQLPVSAMVLVGSIESANALEKTDLALLRAAVGAELQIVGVGGAKTPESVIAAYMKEGVSTVYHVESVPGQVAMVMVLEGRSGNYGSGKASQRLLPEPVVQ